PETGAEVTLGEEAAVVESVKAAGEVKSPLSGTVTEINPQLADSPEQVNEDPEGGGWFYKMNATDPRQLERLMDADAYRQFVGQLD
ncbi:MAG: glycine cleavage system protein H, partial [Gammaproteobacteria bacterium]|nr:glycine cleavage system protein H [Gammaproteobacteria bacterium]